MALRRWQRVSLGILLLLACVGLAVKQFITIGVAETYSSSWHSSSSRESEQRGLLIARLPVTPDSITLDGQRLAVIEAWLEPQTHVTYRYFLFHRLVRDSTQLLIVRTSMSGTHLASSPREPTYLAYNDSLGFSAFSGSEYWLGIAPQPLPDTVRLFTRKHW